MDWFQTLTGLPDDRPDSVRGGLRAEGDWLIGPGGRRLRMGRLTTPSLADLRVEGLPERGPTRVSEVIADAAALHADPANAGAVIQVASQFNLLEMVGPSVTPEEGIARYAHDLTQGPACAMACAAGTIWRNYLVPVGGQTGQGADRQLDMAEDLHMALRAGGPPLWTMRNGYLLPLPGGLERAAAVIGTDPDLFRGLQRVGVQQDTAVTLPGADHTVTQVYASAAPVAYAPAPGWAPLARLILEAAYEATLRIAARTPKRPVFLTLLGGGAFGNDTGWIVDAMSRALDIVAPAGLDVRIVSFRRPNPALAPLLSFHGPRSNRPA